jgi:hypothetical protein
MTLDIIPHSYPVESNILVYVDNMLLVNNYRFEIGFDTSTANPLLHDIAFEKIDLFFNAIFPNSIIITHEDFQKKTVKYNNNYVELYDMLNDQSLGSALFCKLTAMVGEDLDIIYLKISSSLGKRITYTINEAGPEIHTLLPNKDDWWENKEIKNQPWWMRPDPATYDEILEGDDIYKGEFTWEEHFQEDLEEAENISNPKNKFKIINGGKDTNDTKS